MIFTTRKQILNDNGEVLTFEGQRIQAQSWDEAEKLIKEKYPYLTIEGEYICTVRNGKEKNEQYINLIGLKFTEFQWN